jgi:leucyl/phenylalanyl-tRNA--protein transferase
VALGGEVSPAWLLGAYRRGIFCQPRSRADEVAEAESIYSPDVEAGDVPVLPGPGNPYSVAWWSPSARYCIAAEDVHIGRTLKRILRRSSWTTTVDYSFDEVVSSCRDGRRPEWITPQLIEALRILHACGWIHTLEVWDGSEIIGGIFGYCFGNILTVDSVFHKRPHAGSVAIVDAARRAHEVGLGLLDVQVRNEFTLRLGAKEMQRRRYLDIIGDVNRRAPLDKKALPVSRLAVLDGVSR